MIKVGITHGDINGISYEVILKTLSDARILEICTPVIYGSAKVAAYHRKALEMPNINMSIINNAEQIGNNRINIINCIDEEIKVELSKSTPAAGESSLAALERATSDIQNGLIDVLITSPVNKNNMPEKPIKYSSNLEYFQQKHTERNNDTLVVLVNNNLRIALATEQIPLAEVTKTLTTKMIVEKLRAFKKSLITDFGIIAPKIAVLALNPHIEDKESASTEENNIIIPALQEAEKEKIICFGPYSADDFFGTGTFEKFDGVLAMYYDQGLIPFKTIAMESGVNYTAGFPFVCTSPVHGVEYDMAGKNMAIEDSFRNAMYLAVDIFKNRHTHNEATANPLRKQYFERGSDNEKLDLSSEQ